MIERLLYFTSAFWSAQCQLHSRFWLCLGRGWLWWPWYCFILYKFFLLDCIICKPFFNLLLTLCYRQEDWQMYSVLQSHLQNLWDPNLVSCWGVRCSTVRRIQMFIIVWCTSCNLKKCLWHPNTGTVSWIPVILSRLLRKMYACVVKHLINKLCVPVKLICLMPYPHGHHWWTTAIILIIWCLWQRACISGSHQFHSVYQELHPLSQI